MFSGLQLVMVASIFMAESGKMGKGEMENKAAGSYWRFMALGVEYRAQASTQNTVASQD